MELRIPADVDDIEAIIALGRKMHAEGVYCDLDFDDKKLRKLGLAILQGKAENYLALVIEHKGVVIGALVAYITEFYFGHDLRADDMIVYVDKSARGGVAARKMITHYAEWAREKGCVEAYLGITVGINNDMVAELYERLGFMQFGAIHRRRL